MSDASLSASAPVPSEKPGAGTRGIHHLALRTDDIDALAAFYREVFGLEIVRDARPVSIWLAIDHGSVLMIERRGRHEPAIVAGSMELFALAATLEQRAAIRARAARRGCLDGETEHTVYLRDPDGRRVGVSSYSFVA